MVYSLIVKISYHLLQFNVTQDSTYLKASAIIVIYLQHQRKLMEFSPNVNNLYAEKVNTLCKMEYVEAVLMANILLPLTKY